MWFKSTQLDLYRRQSVTYTNTAPSTASPSPSTSISMCLWTHFTTKLNYYTSSVCFEYIYNLTQHTWRPRILWWFTKQVFWMFIHQPSAHWPIVAAAAAIVVCVVYECMCEREREEAVCANIFVSIDTNRHLIDVPKCLLWNYPNSVFVSAPAQAECRYGGVATGHTIRHSDRKWKKKCEAKY